MKAKETYQERLLMVGMHDAVLQRLDNAISEKKSIEACWLCYSCFESRITRTLEKVSECCPERKCYQNHKVGIKARIECLKRLSKSCYAGSDCFDNQLLGQIIAWCKERNTLVHDLLTLNNYYGMDDKFLQLAVKGKPLVKELYSQTTKFRNNYYELDAMLAFPQNAHSSCRLLRKPNQPKE